MRKELYIIKGGYYVEVSGSGRKKVVWEVIQDHVINEPKAGSQISGLEFNFNLFGEYRGGEIIIEYFS